MALPELKDFYLPGQPGEVARLFEEYEDSALFVAGGTFIRGLGARGLLGGVQALVDLRRMGLDAIAADERGFRIGATVKISANRKGGGSLTIRFGSLDQLDGLLTRLG